MHYTRNILLGVIAVTIVALAIYAFIFFEVRRTSRATATLRQSIEQEVEEQGRKDSLQVLVEETESERAELMTRVISEDSLVRFFEELEVLAEEAGVVMEIDRIQEHVELDPVIPESDDDEKEPKPEPHPASEDLEWLQMDISAGGSWESVYHFLSFVELMPYEISLSNMHFEKVDATEVLASTEEDGEAVEVSPGEVWELTMAAKILRTKGE